MFAFRIQDFPRTVKYELPRYTYDSPEDSIDKLIKSLPRSYSGSPGELRNFIKKVDAVFKKAKDQHKSTILAIVKERMKGRAKALLDSKPDAATWKELTKQLEELSLDNIWKKYSEMLDMLCSMKQMKDETIAEFYDRLLDLRTKIKKELLTMHRGSVDYRGRVDMLQDLVLNRFVYHSHPWISKGLQRVRFDSIETALKRAELAIPLEYC